MALKMADVNLFEEFFTHVNDETGVQTTYASARLADFCAANPEKVRLEQVPVEEHHARYCYEYRGVERERLEVLCQNPDYLKKPILFLALPDTTHLLLDGTHRYVCYFGLKVPMIPAYIVPWEIGKEFIVEDAPQTDPDHLMDHSHLALFRKLGLVK